LHKFIHIETVGKLWLALNPGKNLSMQPQELKELKTSLKEVNCPRSLHEIYFFLTDVIVGTRVAGPS
jgi:hypothetical protein